MDGSSVILIRPFFCKTLALCRSDLTGSFTLTARKLRKFILYLANVLFFCILSALLSSCH